MVQIPHRVELVVGGEADRVAQVAGAEEGQHQEGAVAHSPIPQSLSEVLIVLFQAEARRDVEDAADAEGGVERDARDVRCRLVQLELQDIVQGGEQVIDIPEEVGHAGAHRVRQDRFIALSRRFDHRLVDRVVEPVNTAIDGFERIARIGGRGAAGKDDDAGKTDTAQQAERNRGHDNVFPGVFS